MIAETVIKNWHGDIIAWIDKMDEFEIQELLEDPGNYLDELLFEDANEYRAFVMTLYREKNKK